MVYCGLYMPYKPMLPCRKVCNAFMFPFIEVDRFCQLLRASECHKRLERVKKL